MIGRTLAHYRIVEKIGAGGMGEVYLAQDTKLDRNVALKFLPEFLQDDEIARKRFLREAKSAAALDHPYICHIHEIGEAEGKLFISMEYVQGKTLKDRLAESPLTLKEALRIAAEIAEGLEIAHKQNVVHRDLKPSNIMLTPEGHAKVMDFGLAKRLILYGEAESEAQTVTGSLTRSGATVGTLAYMSPEQLRGEPADLRSDIFSFGIVLYEMLTGKHPFLKRTPSETAGAILNQPAPPLKSAGLEVLRATERILARCLEKNREARYRSAAELREEVAQSGERLLAQEAGLRTIFRRPGVRIAAAFLIVALAVIAIWVAVQYRRTRWARQEALPQITRLLDNGDLSTAYRLTRSAEKYLSETEVERLWREHSELISIHTTPPGADLYLREYLAEDAPWEAIGKSPVENLRLPRLDFRARASLAGYETLEVAFFVASSGSYSVPLDAAGTIPPGMVKVPGGEYEAGPRTRVQLGDYWIDMHEITNRQYKEFVDRGGYQTPEFWKHPFVKDGRTLSWEEAMGQFRDKTGRPGPSTWEFGSYPEGQAEYPVGGVSWYEAAAYAEFAGKSLPTVYHWYRAAGGRNPTSVSSILKTSNFGQSSPSPVGGGLGLWGTFDMAGNVREWCWNEGPGGNRYVLGGAWNEPSYLFHLADSRSPFDRSETNGFRLVKYTTPLSEQTGGPVQGLFRDFTKEKPVEQAIFRVYLSLYSYDHTDLQPATEATEDAKHWRREKVSFRAAYGNQRVVAYLFLPNNAEPPYQTVVYFPHMGALYERSSENLQMQPVEFLTRSGRAVMYPIYKGTYERGADPARPGSIADRDLVIQWGKDLGRSVDYLETRQDIDSGKLAFYGWSLGGVYGPLLTAVNGRFKASVLVSGGLPASPAGCCVGPLPEADPFHFAPRDRTPTLMLNGRGDVITPVEISQVPMFRLLGAPPEHKKHLVFEAGHTPHSSDVIRETLDWLDRYQGPVR